MKGASSNPLSGDHFDCVARNCRTMKIFFSQLFLIADEVVRECILVKLTLKDLSILERALNNHNAFRQCRRWFRNMTHDLRSGAQANSLYIDWMQARGIMVGTLRLMISQRTTWLECLKNRTLVASDIEYCLPNNFVAVQFLVSFRELNSVCLSTEGYLGDRGAWKTFFMNNPNLREFVLLGDWKCYWVHDLFVMATTHLQCLTALSWENCVGIHNGTVDVIARHWRNLTELRLRECSNITDKSLDAVAQYCSKLLSLQLTAWHGCVSVTVLINLLCQCKQLRSVKLWDCSGLNISSTAIKNSIARSGFGTQLTTLELNNCTAVLSQRNEAALIQLCNLTHLRFSTCTALSEQLLISIVSNNHQLTCVTLNKSGTVTDAVVAALGASCPLLRLAMLDNCTAITDITPLSRCPELTYLKLNGCTGVTQAALLKLAQTPGKKIDVYVSYGNIVWDVLHRLVYSPRICLHITKNYRW